VFHNIAFLARSRLSSTTDAVPPCSPSSTTTVHPHRRSIEGSGPPQRRAAISLLLLHHRLPSSIVHRLSQGYRKQRTGRRFLYANTFTVGDQVSTPLLTFSPSLSHLGEPLPVPPVPIASPWGGRASRQHLPHHHAAGCPKSTGKATAGNGGIPSPVFLACRPKGLMGQIH
jgi:hypothetical protein